MKLARVLVGLLVIAGAIVWLAKPVSEPMDGEQPDGQPTAETRRPNVVLISLDTLRPDHLGCYGYSRKTSPNLDELAQDAVLFTNARCQAPWTLPSHMSLFTSMLPSHNGVEDLNEVLADDVPLLAEILQKNGYLTAAIVNNGQMKAHWGFSRGFETWREFQVDTPEGNCENITKEALAWLQSSADQPFFLFLHYFDVHEPYEAAEPFRKQFGVTLTGQQTRQAMWEARFPKGLSLSGIRKERVIRAYDAEIAWLDSQLGKLFEQIPPDTLVVIFSDHGEAFEEHGWTLHGATLYEEEIRVLLLVSDPRGTHKGRKVDEPVMLLDAAPTILRRCRIDPPDSFEGVDLYPLLAGGSLAARAVLSETKRVLEGRALKMVSLHPWKMVYSLFDGSIELYGLPDEQKDLASEDPKRTEALSGVLREWVAEEDFLVVYSKGQGRFEATAKAPPGKLLVFIPIGFELGRDHFEVLPDRQGLHWTAFPGGGTKGVYMQFVPESLDLSLDLRVNEERQKHLVFLGQRKTHPAEIPFSVPVDPEKKGANPVMEKPFAPQEDGFHIIRYGAEGKPRRTARPGQLDEETTRQLRSLGYIQ